jgi:diadenosine tetraphosphatase ApaH/serine/threonine PP2A family protein phosphatase
VAALPRIGRQGGFAFFHGAPADDSVYLLTRPEDGRLAGRPANVVEQLLGEIRERVILCGHDHTPAVVRLDDGRTIVNPGSVGCPAYEDGVPEAHVVEAGSPDARYAVVAWDGDEPRVELVPVPYDADAAADEAARNGFPDWACWVRTGRVAAR